MTTSPNRWTPSDTNLIRAIEAIEDCLCDEPMPRQPNLLTMRLRQTRGLLQALAGIRERGEELPLPPRSPEGSPR